MSRIVANALFQGFGIEVFAEDDGEDGERVCCLVFFKRLHGPEYSASLACAEDTGLLETDRGLTKAVPEAVIARAYEFAGKHGY